MRPTRLTALAAAASALTLLTGCSTGQAAGTSGTTPASGSTSVSTARPGATKPAPAPQPTVAKPAKDSFTVCDTRTVTKDVNGLSRCATSAHQIPAGARTLSCLADLGTSAPAATSLVVTYSVFKDGRNVANQFVVPKRALTAKSFQLRYDFKPADVRWTGATLPPGSYYCEWYDPAGSRVGSVDVIHGQLASSTVGTPGYQY